VSDGKLWTKTRAQPRRVVAEVAKADIPTDPGVYFRKRGQRHQAFLGEARRFDEVA
jgi:hypothetical protein